MGLAKRLGTGLARRPGSWIHGCIRPHMDLATRLGSTWTLNFLHHTVDYASGVAETWNDAAAAVESELAEKLPLICWKALEILLSFHLHTSLDSPPCRPSTAAWSDLPTRDTRPIPPHSCSERVQPFPYSVVVAPSTIVRLLRLNIQSSRLHSGRDRAWSGPQLVTTEEGEIRKLRETNLSCP
jgi:hypothetical protein